MRTLAALLALSFAPALAPSAHAAQEQKGDDEPCEVIGRLLDVAGQPVAGALLQVSGWAANSTRVQRYGTPKNWVNPDAVQSDDEGRFVLSFVPPRAFQFVISVASEGHGGVAWRWSQILPGATVDLEDTTLEPPAVIVGHITDTAGKLLVEGWRVAASHNWNGSTARRPRSTKGSNVVVDPATGTFRIEDLPPGEVRLSASNATGTRIEALFVVTKVGEETEVELVYKGPDPTTRIVMSISTRPFHAFAPDAGTVHAIAGDGTRTAFTPVPGRANDWHATDLAPGAYTLEITDDKFLPWRREDIRPGGATPRARLTGSATLELEVIDTANGDARISAYGLRIEYMNARFSPNSFTLQDDLGLAPADHRFVGIVPGSWELEVRPPGGPPALVEVLDLAGGETRKVVVRLGVAGTVAGRVLHPDGRPAAGTRVQITRGTSAGHDGPEGAVTNGARVVDGKHVQFRIEYRDAEVLTAADGSYTFRDLAPGTYALRAIVSPWSYADALVEVSESTTSERALTLPQTGAARVRLALPPQVDPTTYFVGFHSPSGLPLSRPRPDEPAGAFRLDANSACTLPGLPPGDASLYLTWFEGDGAGSAFPSYPLGVASIASGGISQVTYDLSANFPTRGELNITLGGETAQGMSVFFERIDVDEGQQSEFQGSVYKGRGSITALPPGRYRVSAEAFRAGWNWSFDEEQVVVNATPFTFTADIPLIERTLHVVDEQGRDVAATAVEWEGEGARHGSGLGDTDARGRLTISVPPGAYTLRHGQARKGGVEIKVAAGAGELEVRLPPPDEDE